VRGAVLDAFEHAIVGARIVLERRVGLAWRAVGSTRTDAQGKYTALTRVAGRYRVAVARTPLRSPSLPIRK
jgi:Carboxypeptidase regulatory-like domain